MRRRLYFLIPDAASARQVTDELSQLRLKPRHIHFLAGPATDIGGLHEANLLQRTDEVHGGAIGMVLTGTAGLLIGIGLYVVGLGDYQPSWVVIPGLALFGLAFGFWSGGLIGTAISNPSLEKFQREMETGRILLMADVPRADAVPIRKSVLMHHPEVTDAEQKPSAIWC